MELTVLGSGGCMIIPRPCCQCRICTEARQKGIPYSRSGPSAFIHDINLLIDTPAEIAIQLNRSDIHRVSYLMLTHLDPDHIEGLRVIEQIALDFRTWTAYPEKQITLLLPKELEQRLSNIHSQHGPVTDFYRDSGFIKIRSFEESIEIDGVRITALPVNRKNQTAFVYVLIKDRRKLVYAPCDIKPFPEQHEDVQNADLLVIQPGIFEDGAKHDFHYPPDHISRTTLYTYDQTLALAERIRARKVLFVHLEEYWGCSYDDYCTLELLHKNIRFAYDGMHLTI